jgi:catecholate siderophore receptor
MQSSVVVSDSASYQMEAIRSGTKTLTPLQDLPQSVSVVTRELVNDQMMLNMGDVARYAPGITAIQGENNRDQLVIRGNSSSADFFLKGVRDDVQYDRDLYNIDEVGALKGPNAMLFGRGGGGGVINRVTKEAGSAPLREFSVFGGAFGEKRMTADLGHPFQRSSLYG